MGIRKMLNKKTGKVFKKYNTDGMTKIFTAPAYCLSSGKNVMVFNSGDYCNYGDDYILHDEYNIKFNEPPTIGNVVTIVVSVNYDVDWVNRLKRDEINSIMAQHFKEKEARSRNDMLQEAYDQYITLYRILNELD